MTPAKGQLEEPSPTIASMLGDFPQYQRKPRSQSNSQFLKVQYGYWDSELDYRWRGKIGKASVGREGSFKQLIYINKNISIYLYLKLIAVHQHDLFSVCQQNQ